MSNHSLIRLIKFVSQFTNKLWNYFLFHLNFILHACKILLRWNSFGILNFATKQRVSSCRGMQATSWLWLASLAVGSSTTKSAAGWTFSMQAIDWSIFYAASYSTWGWVQRLCVHYIPSDEILYSTVSLSVRYSRSTTVFHIMLHSKIWMLRRCICFTCMS